MKNRIYKPDKLSVMVLSSGREESIERCLLSLAELKKSLEVEIIVVDTDKSHNPYVADIVNKYADVIIDYEWQEDFASARNVGLKAASGAWLFYIDDDEWLLDAAPLIEFLNSPKNKKAQWANVRVRNYFNTEFTEYTDTWVTRLFRIQKDSHFVGIIHEYYEPVEGELSVIHALIGHSGYIYENKRYRRKKNKRNIRLLNKALADDPDNVRWWIQIIQEYASEEKYGKVCNLCEEYIQRINLAKITDENRRYIQNMRGVLVCAYIRAMLKMKKWESARNMFMKYANLHSYGLLAQAHLFLEGAIAFCNMKLFENAKTCCIGYIKLYEEYLKSPDDYVQDMYYVLEETFADYNLNTIRVILSVGKLNNDRKRLEVMANGMESR